MSPLNIILGCGNPEGAQGHNIARNVAVLSDLPIQTGGVTINRYCSSGLKSIAMAATQIQSGFYDCIIAGGVESISTTQGKGNMHMYVNEKLAEEVPGIYHEIEKKDYKDKEYNYPKKTNMNKLLKFGYLGPWGPLEAAPLLF